MGNQPIQGLIAQSVPIGKINPIYNSADYKRQQALVNSSQLTQGIYESIEDYQKRLADFRAEQAKKIQEENTKTAEKKYRDIANLNVWNTNNLTTLQNAQNQLSSFFRFNQFNTLNPSFDNQIYLAKKLQSQVEERMTQIKQNGKAPSGNRLVDNYNQNPNYAATEFQSLGERDILA